MKKILVVSGYEVKSIFSSPSKYNLNFVSPENALMEFLSESPEAVLLFAEYEGDKFEEARNAMKDIKTSNNGSKIFRLGFLPAKNYNGETYLRLPVSLADEDLDKLLE